MGVCVRYGYVCVVMVMCVFCIVVVIIDFMLSVVLLSVRFVAIYDGFT